MNKNQSLLKNYVEKKNFIEKNFVKLSTISFNCKNSSFILGRRNELFFYKSDKFILFLNEILYFYLNSFSKQTKNLLFLDKKLSFLFGKEACLRSFQTVFFGKYSGGIFTNNLEKNIKYRKLFSDVDMFFFTGGDIFSIKEVNLLKKPLTVFMGEKTNLENYLFYRTMFYNDPYFFDYFIFKMMSDLLIKIQIYDYIELKKEQCFLQKSKKYK